MADLRLQRRRVSIVAVAVAVGTAALTTALSARAVLEREITASFQASLPPTATVWLDRVDEPLLASVRALEGVRDADAGRLVRARVQVMSGEWLPLALHGVRDFDDLRVAAFRPVSGDFPPKDGEVSIEQSALGVLSTSAGESLTVRLPGGHQGTVRVSGVIHDPGQAPGWQDHEGYAYATPATLERLGLGSQLDELRLVLGGHHADIEASVLRTVRWLAACGHVAKRVEIHSGKHPHEEHMRVVLILLTTFSALALVLAGFLTLTVVSALMARQTREIGSMKAVGATSLQVARIYATFVLILTVAGVAVGFPLGTLCARWFAGFAASQLNLRVQSFGVPLAVIIGEVLVIVSIPFVAAAFPIVKTARMTVREAIQSVGISDPPSRPPRASSTRGVLHSWTWRSLARRPARLAMTLTALAVGGAALMTAQNVHRGLIATVDAAIAARGDDVDVRLLRPAPAQELVAAVGALPGVGYAEAWGCVLASIRLGGSGSATALGTARYSLFAPPTESRMPRPRLVAGRSFDASGTEEAVVNRGLLAREPQLGIGDTIDLLGSGRHAPVRIVGVAEEVGAPSIYVSPGTMARIVGAEGQAGALRLTVAAGEQTRVAARVEQLLVDRGWFPVHVMTRDNLRAAMVDHFMIMLALLSSAAVASLIVGALGLSTSVGLSVLERSRDIAVLRALGASDRRVRQMVFTEGAIVGALSAALAVALSLPLTAGVQSVIGERGLHIAMPFSVSPQALGVWAVAAACVAFLASWLPARDALLSPVHEVLSRE